MAYFNQDEDEDENSQGMNQQAAPQEAAAPVQLGAQSGSLGGASNGNVQKAPATPASGSAPGFQNYAKANVGIAQGRLNNAAAKNVSNQGQQAKTAIGQATTGFGQRVEQGSLANRQNAVQDVTNITQAARAVTAPPKPLQATAQPQNVPAPTATAAPAPVAPSLSDEQTNRFSEVINSRYKGPESLRQAGLYQLASGKVGTAQNTLNQTKTAGGREEMLKNQYQQQGNYSTGANKLDSALLNASKQGVQNLQNAATVQGNVQQQLDRAQIDSAVQAQNRTNELQDIKNQAMGVFTEGKKAEEKATEDRMNAMLVTPVKDAQGNDIMKADGSPMTQWDQLPESFKDIIRNKKTDNAATLATETAKIKGDTYDPLVSQVNTAKQALERARVNNERANNNYFNYADEHKAKQKVTYDNALANYNTLTGQKSALDEQLAALNQQYNPNAVNFNEFEAQTLGVDSGEGFYNLGENAIKSGVADRNKLVSRDEQARQAMLAQLAGLDQSNRLDTNLRYDDAEKAGTQSILDSLDLEGTRRNIDSAEDNFQDAAEGTNLTGQGHKKVSRGNAFGKTTRTYRATMKGNAGDMLKKAGYNFDEADSNSDIGGQKELLNAALQASRSDSNAGTVDRDAANAQLMSTAQGAGMGAAVGSAVGPIGTAAGAIGGGIIGSVAGSGTLDGIQTGTNLLSGYAPGAAKVIQDGRNEAGNASENYMRAATMGGSDLAKSLGLGNFAGGVGSAVRGIDTGAMAAMGNQVAKKHAAQDLIKKYSGFLDTQGFGNRVNVEENQQTQSRSNALQQLLASFDKTNT